MLSYRSILKFNTQFPETQLAENGRTCTVIIWRTGETEKCYMCWLHRAHWRAKCNATSNDRKTPSTAATAAALTMTSVTRSGGRWTGGQVRGAQLRRRITTRVVWHPIRFRLPSSSVVICCHSSCQLTCKPSDQLLTCTDLYMYSNNKMLQ